MKNCIIITIGSAYLKENGYRNWLSNLLRLNSDFLELGYTYWFRQGNKPTKPVEFVYLCIGGKIRWRVTLVNVHGPEERIFIDETRPRGTKTLFGKAWLECCGPVTPAPYPIPIRDVLPNQKNTGFQGFRYCDFLF